MSMSLILCAPLRGFQAFRMPEIKRDSDDTLALPGSLYDFQEGGTAYVATRYSLSNGTIIQRLAIYRQVYEPHLKRLGHSFGVILECRDYTPDANKAVEVLSDLITSITQHCVEGGVVCQEQNFLDFLHNKVSAVVPQMLNQLQSGSQQPIEGLKLGLQLKSVSFELESTTLQLFSEVTSLWNWYFTSPGSLLISTLVAATRQSGRFGADVAPTHSLIDWERMASRTLLEYSRACQDENGKVKSELTNLLSERNKLQINVDELQEKIQTTEQALSKTTMQLQSLRQTSAPFSQVGAPRYALTDADFLKIKSVVQDAFRQYEPQQLSAVNENSRRVKQESWYENWIVLILAGGLALGGVIFFAFQAFQAFL